MKRALLAEVLGTFILVFAGTGAIIVDQLSGKITHPGIALVFGLVVFSLIQAFGDVSGAHFNPAVTLAFWWSGSFPRSHIIPYLLCQCLGAILASGLLLFLFPSSTTLGATRPADTPLQSFLLELFLTWFLMLVVLQVAKGSQERGLLAGLTIGSVIALEALFAGPITGASMNPARSLGPALISVDLRHLWVYLTAPVFGAILAVPTWQLLKPPE